MKAPLWAAAFFTLAASAFAQQHPSRGLWVGEIILNKVNEVTVPINAQNIPIAPNPTNVTETADRANLRLILHVDGTGKVKLLKSVAIVDKGGTNQIASTASPTNIASYSYSSVMESNLVLLTDEALYPNYPGVASRFASVVFDFSNLTAVNSAKAVAPKSAAAARAASDTANAASPSASLTTVSNSVRAAAFSAAASTSSSGADAVVMTNVVNAIVAATIEELSRVRARPTVAYADQAKVEKAASDKAALALQTETRAVGAVPVNFVELSGALVPNQTVTGTAFLGEDHPTNPFRHKFHPDHQYGYDITRNFTLKVSAPASGESFDRGGYGVDRLTGIYREEIFGLHKALGQARNIGLITEGVFILNRITYKDSLNQ